jgi:hypothetical protein
LSRHPIRGQLPSQSAHRICANFGSASAVLVGSAAYGASEEF